VFSGSGRGKVSNYDPEADVITLATFEKMVLMLIDTSGMMAPAATATNPAISAYSIKSWPSVSFRIAKRIANCFSRFMEMSLSSCCGIDSARSSAKSGPANKLQAE
jgi:hypothetical protein